MIDRSYYVPLLPGAEEALDTERANAIEANVSHLIQSWPVFETETIRALIGSLGYLQTDESATPAQGAEVTFLRVLPRLLVFLTGDGLERITWTGEGWTAEAAPEGLTLAFPLFDPTEAEAMAALGRLVIRSDGPADVTLTFAAERADGSLRLPGQSVTRMLFREKGTWVLLREKNKIWAEASSLTWAGAAALKKE